MTLTKTSFGTIDGRQVDLFTIDFNAKLRASITNFGGILTSLFLPVKHGSMRNVVLGYNNLNTYVDDQAYMGAIIGRCCNRITDGKFTLEGKKYNLVTNDGSNHLHGGSIGFNKKIWEIINIQETSGKVVISLQYDSADGEEGYPGNLSTIITYIFTPEAWQIDYKATTDATTLINLTQHAYFNLSGNPDADIIDHELQLNADFFLPIDNKSIPTGELQEVKDTPFDFTSAKQIGKCMAEGGQQIHFGQGYDHCWVLQGDLIKSAATLYHPQSGRKLEVFTDQPGIQLYTGNFLAGIAGRKGKALKSRSGLCLETQHFPDSVNQPHFPSVVLQPDEVFRSTTIYKFSLK